MSEGIVAGRIRQTLEEALVPLSLEVIDESARHAGHAHVVSRVGSASGAGETHFRIKVVAESFRGKTRLERHRDDQHAAGRRIDARWRRTRWRSRRARPVNKAP